MILEEWKQELEGYWLFIKQRWRMLCMFTGIFLVIGVILYFFLGFAARDIIAKLPYDNDIIEKVNIYFGERETRAKLEPLQKDLQGFLDELMAFLPDTHPSYKIFVLKSRYVNATTHPGGQIVLTTSLLKNIASENELAMVLAHELGHYVQKDHLYAMGRRVVFIYFASKCFGPDSRLTKWVRDIMPPSKRPYTPEQELLADRFAVELVNKKYGHIGGHADFLVRMQKKYKPHERITHPTLPRRIEKLKELVSESDYELREVTPLKNSLQQHIEDILPIL